MDGVGVGRFGVGAGDFHHACESWEVGFTSFVTLICSVYLIPEGPSLEALLLASRPGSNVI